MGPYAEPDCEQEYMREMSSVTPLHVFLTIATSLGRNVGIGPLCSGSPSAHAALLSFDARSILTEFRAFLLKSSVQE